MKRIIPLRALGAVSLLLAFCARPIDAQTAGISYTSSSGTTVGLDDTYGWAFTVTTPLLLTDLGIRDLGGATGDDGSNGGGGLDSSHLVTIWTSLGVQVAQATVPAGTAGTLIAGYRYVALGSAILLAPGSYVIGAYYFNDIFDRIAFGASGIMTTNGVVYDGSRSGHREFFPTGDASGHTNSYFGPNFLAQVPKDSVPDSASTFLLLAIAGGGVCLVARKLGCGPHQRG